MKCPYCGKENEKDTLYCVYCGKPLKRNLGDRIEEEDDPTVPLDYSAQEEDSQYFANDQYDDTDSVWDDEPVQKNKKQMSMRSLTYIKIALLVVLIALVAGGGTFFYFNMNKTDTKTTTEKVSNKKSTSAKEEKNTPVTTPKKEKEVVLTPSTTTEDNSSSDTSSDTTSDTTTDSDTTENTSSDTSTSSDSSDYILPDSSSSYVSDSELSSLSKDELAKARNEIYARHGYIFHKNQEMKDYFENKSWYEGTTTNQDDISLNKYEQANIDKIRSYEDE